MSVLAYLKIAAAGAPAGAPAPAAQPAAAPPNPVGGPTVMSMGGRRAAPITPSSTTGQGAATNANPLIAQPPAGSQPGQMDIYKGTLVDPAEKANLEAADAQAAAEAAKNQPKPQAAEKHNPKLEYGSLAMENQMDRLEAAKMASSTMFVPPVGAPPVAKPPGGLWNFLKGMTTGGLFGERPKGWEDQLLAGGRSGPGKVYVQAYAQNRADGASVGKELHPALQLAMNWMTPEGTSPETVNAITSAGQQALQQIGQPAGQ